MVPHISVMPSRPFAEKTSGLAHPEARRSAMSVFPNSMTTDPSLAERTTDTGSISGRE